MKNTNQQGFTLVELIIVIVILGVLAVTAAPKFLDIKGDAVGGTLDGVKTAMVGVVNIEKSRTIITTGNETTPTPLQVGNGLDLSATDWDIVYDKDRTGTGTDAPTEVRIYPKGQAAAEPAVDGAFPTAAGAGFDCYVKYTVAGGIVTEKTCD